jgi:NAD(P)-dependent dehydrogenase (short-subunit alcohol dehydrogenase family)
MAADTFRDVVVVVTGTAGQIGSECARAYARAGARVVAVDRDPSPLEGDEFLVLTEDLTSAGAADRVLDAAEEAFGPVGVVAQCAAAHGRMPFLELTPERIDAVLAINVKTTLLVGSAAGRRMAAHGIAGSIVNLTSISGVVSHGESVVYEASKGAVTMATKGMANALAPHGIRVNAVGPGVMVKQQEIDDVRDPLDLDDFERRRIPLRRFGTSAEIAEIVLFLSSPAASYVTGTVVYADGGALSAWSAYEEVT